MTDNISQAEIDKARSNTVFSLIGDIFEKYRRNERGNLVFDSFASINRYFFDTRLKGFEQFDTEQDAWYFGVWVSAEHLCTVTYCEGDITVVICEDKDHYNAEIQSYIDFYEEGFICIAIGENSKTVYQQDRSKFLIP